MSCLISEIGELLIQEAIFPSEYVLKSYFIFGKHFIGLNNQIDSEIKQDQIYDKTTFKQAVVREVSEEEKTVGLLVCEELQKKKFFNFGLDFVRRTGTSDYFFFDINCDNFSWQKNIKGNLPKFFRTELRKISNQS